MSQKDKLIRRFTNIPNDFTYPEMVTLMRIFGYEEKSNDGSRRAFVHSQTGHMIYIHEPHPGNIMRQYALRYAKKELEERGYL